MRQFITIATNAFMELVRQPVFLLLMTSSAVFEIFLATPYYFAFGEEPKLVKNSTLAVMLLAGLLGAVLSASASLAREIRTGTVLAVLSKPVGRAQFLVAKFVGLIAAHVADLCESGGGAAGQPDGVRCVWFDRSVRGGCVCFVAGRCLPARRVQQLLSAPALRVGCRV
jgi:hypothetical protein